MSKGERKSKAKKKATKKKAEKPEAAEEPIEQVEPVVEPVAEEKSVMTPIIMLCGNCGYDVRLCIIKETQTMGAVCVKCGAIFELTSVDVSDEEMANIDIQERSPREMKKLPAPWYIRCLLESLPSIKQLESLT